MVAVFLHMFQLHNGEKDKPNKKEITRKLICVNGLKHCLDGREGEKLFLEYDQDFRYFKLEWVIICYIWNADFLYIHYTITTIKETLAIPFKWWWVQFSCWIATNWTRSSFNFVMRNIDCSEVIYQNYAIFNYFWMEYSTIFKWNNPLVGRILVDVQSISFLYGLKEF